MRKYLSKLAVLLTFALVLQLLVPGLSTLAAAAAPTPANVVLKLTSPSDALLSWNTVSGASYKIYQMNGATPTLVGSTPSTVRSFTNLAEGTYSYAVSSVVSGTESALSAPVSVTVAYPKMTSPNAPTSSVANGNDVALQWNTVPYAQSYNVYEVVNGQPKLVVNTSGYARVLTNVAEGTHQYQVSAYHALYGESALSPVTAVNIAYPAVLPPANFKASIINATDIQLTWSEAAYANSYKVYQIIDGQRVLLGANSGTVRNVTNSKEGTYAFEVVTVSDRFGESKTASATQITVTFPKVQAPADFTGSVVGGNDVLLRWSQPLYATSFTLYQVMNGVRTELATTTSTQRLLSNMPEGNLQYEVVAKSDRFGNSAPATLSLNVVWPKMEPPAKMRYMVTNGNDLGIAWDASAFATSYNLYQVVNGERTLIGTTSGTGYGLKNVPAGEHVFEVQAISDRFGESGFTSLTVNLVYPTMQPPAPLNAAVKNGNDLTLSWSGSLYAERFRLYQVTDGQLKLLTDTTNYNYAMPNLPKGDYLFELRSFSSRFGESPTGTQKLVTIDLPEMKAPNVKLEMLDLTSAKITWYAVEYAEKYNVYQLIGGQPKLIATTDKLEYTVNNLLPTQQYDYVVTAVHTRYGESPKSSKVSTLYDLLAPETFSDVEDGRWYNKDLTVNLIPRDNYSGVKATYLSLDGQPFSQGLKATVQGDGIHTLSFYSEDKVGNVEEKKTVEIKIDSVAPVTTSDYVPGGPLPKVINLSASDNRSGLLSTVYQINGGEKINGTVIPIDESVREVSFYSLDKAYNQETATTIKLVADSTAPVTVSNVKTEWQKDTFQVELIATDDLSGVDKTLYAIGEEGAYQTGTNFAIDQEGITPIRFYSIDQAGNKEGAHLENIKIDRTAPVTTVTLEGEWSKRDITLPLVAKDKHSGVEKTFFSVDGSEFAEGESVTIKNEGTHTISFYSVDKVGNVEEVQTVEVKLDKTAPVTEYTTVKSAIEYGYTILLQANDQLSGVAKTLYSINGAAPVEGTMIELVNEGKHTVTFYSVDVAGNVESSHSVELMVDLTPPVTATAVEEKWYNADVNAGFVAKDELSGVDKTFYALNSTNYDVGTNILVSQEGVHKLNFYSVDKAGNEEKPNQVVFMLDKTAPVTTSSLQGGVVAAGTEVALTANDNLSGVAKTFYSVNGAPFAEGTTIKLDQGGDFEIVFYSVDVAENMEKKQVIQVMVDVTAPITDSNLQTDWYKADIVGKLLATDDLSGVDKTFYSVDGSELAEGSSFIISEEGTHSVSFYSVDKVGNKEEIKTEEVKLDKTAPQTTDNVQPGVAPKLGMEVHLTADDNLSGVDKTFYSLNGAPFVEGDSLRLDREGFVKITYYSVDKAGNEEQPKTVTIMLDVTAPVTEAIVKDSWYTKTATIGLTATDDLSGVDKTFYSVDGADFQEGVALSIEAEGIHQVSFYSVDKAGNIEEVKTVEVKVDKTAPVTVSNLDAPKFGMDVKLTATDNLSGVDKTFYSINGSEFVEGNSFKLDQVGRVSIIFYSIDKAGNEEEKQTFQFLVDITAPVTESDAKEDWYKGTAVINLSATDDLSGVDKTFYSVDGVDFQEGTSVVIAEEGIHQVSFHSVDKAGNVEEVKTVEVKVDKTAPVTADNIDTRYPKPGTSFELTATDNLSGVDKTFYSLNGAEFVSGTAFNLEPGVLKVTYYSVDKAGNKEEPKTIELIVDENPPVTVADAPQGWQNADVSVTLAATDDLSGVDKTFYSVDGGAFVEGTTVSITEPGKHTVTFYSVDKAGNVEAKQTIEVLIDELPPVTTSDIKDIWTNKDVPVTLTATDDLSGVKTTYYTVDGAAKAEGTSFTVANEGIHNVTFYSVDNAGNIEQVNEQEVKIDKTAPTVTLAPLKTEYVMGDKLTLSYTATDNLSGIATSVMTVNGQVVANGTTLTLQPGEYTVQVTATDKAGNQTTTTVQQKFVVAILAEMEVTPGVINPNPGIFTVRLTMPKGYKYNFDLSTVSVNGAKVRGNGNPEGQAASGMFKFERMDVEKWIMPETTLVFRGYTKDGYLVIAKKTVKVNDADGGKGNGGKK